MEKHIEILISKMTLEEKASLCSGMNSWETKEIQRLGIPSVFLADGPHGLRKQAAKSDHLGLYESIPSVCFPTASALASSWNLELMEELGGLLGEECRAEGVHVLLGPGINMKRSPLCGRNFEYFSEDPYLAGELGAAFVQGVQGMGVGTSLKHFAVNNQETNRMAVSAEVDERTLREIYLTGFEKVVKQAQPWSVMCAYNKINDIYCSENRRLLTDILREEWGFEGIVVSDWGAVNDRTEGIKAGLDLEMPSSGGYMDRKIVDAVRVGRLDEKLLDKTVERLLKLIFRSHEHGTEVISCDKKRSHEKSRSIGSECIVLLKNQDEILPISKEKVKKLAIAGAFARKPRFQGGGSSHVNPFEVNVPYDEIEKLAGADISITYAQGYEIESDECNEELLRRAAEAAGNSDMVLAFVGLPDRYESEGYDREHIDIPINHIRLIEEICSVNDNVVVVLNNGSPITMIPWMDKVKGIVEAWLLGEAGGGAIADVLFGVSNPSGKLAETFPRKLSDNPSYLFFPGSTGKVNYNEGVFVGYRYYDARDMEMLFPFGYGLSYTTFQYSDIKMSRTNIRDTDTVEVTVKVSNTGKVYGKDVVQLYVKDVKSSVRRPEKELKGFKKVALDAGETKEISFTLSKRSFAYYSTEAKDWVVESGDFDILIGASSRDIRLKETIYVESTYIPDLKFDKYTSIGQWMSHPKGRRIMSEIMAEFKDSFLTSDGDGEEVDKTIEAINYYMPIGRLINFSQGKFDDERLQRILDEFNNRDSHEGMVCRTNMMLF